MYPKFTIVTNACLFDDIRIIPIVKSWLRVFSSSLNKIIIVLDPTKPTGRIANLHNKSGSLGAVLKAINSLIEFDSRIELNYLPEMELQDLQIASKWFSAKRIPHRCQAGTPIYPFVYSMTRATDELVLKVDCDMVFHDKNILLAASELININGYDLVEPYRWADGMESVSTRAFFFNPIKFIDNCLPMKHARLDPFRSIHRSLKGLPTIMALEATLEKERLKSNIKHCVMKKDFGWSVHIGKRSDFLFQKIEILISQIESGLLNNNEIFLNGNLNLDKLID